MNNCVAYSGRLRSRTKPVYTSDKRAKLTQRENKIWIRLLTVLGYIFFVSLPAVSLSVYYIYIWDPGYINKFQHNLMNHSNPIHKDSTVTSRLQQNTDSRSFVIDMSASRRSIPTKHTFSSYPFNTVDLATILAEGSRSMEEASFEAIHSSPKRNIATRA
ncbi:hypothetical protein DICVIV_10741 [Dictyocaulus viviparus]|uniref:Uncharacterized protein n=1 Tax=Dictyocaulus viviparus TaxID=29172 RepID=A0A0D8XHM6_DICVI|nr:hypothetical protein DICVIV_10741 [Dictyocaulus viviparus]